MQSSFVLFNDRCALAVLALQRAPTYLLIRQGRPRAPLSSSPGPCRLSSAEPNPAKPEEPRSEEDKKPQLVSGHSTMKQHTMKLTQHRAGNTEANKQKRNRERHQKAKRPRSQDTRKLRIQDAKTPRHRDTNEQRKHETNKPRAPTTQTPRYQQTTT